MKRRLISEMTCTIFSKQALIGVGGFIGMYLVSKLDYHLYGAFAFEIYVISMFLMALVQTPLGVTVNGARRWIGLPGNLSLQPAEITKKAVILFISYELCRLGKKGIFAERNCTDTCIWRSGIGRRFVFDR